MTAQIDKPVCADVVLLLSLYPPTFFSPACVCVALNLKERPYTLPVGRRRDPSYFLCHAALRLQSAGDRWTARCLGRWPAFYVRPLKMSFTIKVSVQI